MINRNQRQEFWLTNICNMNVSLADLNLTIKAFSSINILDKKHYSYTLEQIKKSVESGSIFKKRNKIVVRKIAPEILTANVPSLSETFMPSRVRSTFNIKEDNYEELGGSIEDQKLSDEKFAQDNADLVELDNKPFIKG